jgi:putative tryptophan/tyrosine transport system substrate-binding protein
VLRPRLTAHDPFRKSAKKDMLLDCRQCFHISIWAVSCRILISMANMQRREFITLFCGLVAWPCVVLAQARRTRPRIGWLKAAPQDSPPTIYIRSFLEGMRELGYTEGQDFEMVYRSYEGRADRVPGAALELVRQNPDIIIAPATLDAVALKQTTATIPIIVPALAEKAATNLKAELLIADVRTKDDVGPAYEMFAMKHAEVVVVEQSTLLVNTSQHIAEIPAANKMPTIYGYRQHVEAGGLISYGVNLIWCFHRAAYFVDRILKGARPSDLPVEFPTNLELVINLQAAKALGLTVSPILLARADKLIE